MKEECLGCQYNMCLLFIVIVFTGMTTMVCAAGNGGPPADIELLFDGFFREYLALHPEFGTGLGLPSHFGISVNNAELNEITDENTDKIYALYRKYYNWLSHYDKATMRREQQINYAVLKWFLEDELAGEEFRYHSYIINPVLSFHNQLTTTLTINQQIRNEKDAEDYLKRLSLYGRKFVQVTDQIKVQQEKGIMPPSDVIEAFQQALDDFIAVPSQENVLFTSFMRKLGEVQSMSESKQMQFGERALAMINTTVYPSYRKLSEYIETLLDKKNTDAGVWKLPDGDAYYRFCLRQHTTLDITPDEVHELGLQEVERIEKELAELYSELGIPEGISLAERRGHYREILSEEEGRFFYPDYEYGKRQTIEGYQAIVDSMYVHLPEMFSVLPKVGVHVERVPAFKENTVGTHYDRPSLDGSKEGIFLVNLTYRHAKPSMKTLTYHEAIPGHHLQIAIAQESSTLRLFRALLHFSGYVEGWALYAEKLAGEYGMFPDIYSRIGYLSSELFRAVRLVVDTGVHSKKWTRDEVAQYMLEHVGWAGEGEINRYITWPGQACAYKIGELKILELRDRAKQELGDKFDIKEFHSVVLGYGSLPLEVLEQVIETYIDETKNK